MKRGLKYLFVTGLIICCVFMYSLLKRRDNKATENAGKKRIYITGSACNIPGHAAIITASSNTYLIRGMYAWDREWIDHQIKVVGDMETTNVRATVFIDDAVIQLLND